MEPVYFLARLETPTDTITWQLNKTLVKPALSTLGNANIPGLTVLGSHPDPDNGDALIELLGTPEAIAAVDNMGFDILPWDGD